VCLKEEVLVLDVGYGIARSLCAKVGAAVRVLKDCNEKNNIAASKSLEAFINGVEALRGEKIPEADADGLIAAAGEIICLLKAP